jgi:ABC-type phosphate/phosphonate transport system ATPase subunit
LSSLLRCINRLIDPTEGRVIWNDIDVTAAQGAELRHIRRQIGMIFQYLELLNRQDGIMSTVIGFVGGGGIGQQFRLWVQLNQYSAAGMATWAIVAMVWNMDYFSARTRERLV